MLVAINDLSGLALDWAVAKVEGLLVNNEAPVGYHPSTDYCVGGPLIDKYKLEFYATDTGPQYQATAMFDYTNTVFGDSSIIATCRAIVAVNLGANVEVPDELVTT